jgi:hypothetical protein
MMKALVVAGIIAAGVMGAISFGSADPASAGTPTNRMTVDLDTTTAGIQASRTIASNATVEIAIVSSNISDAYNGYQWELQWDNATLNFVSASENTAGHGGTLCAGVGVIDDTGGAPSGKEWAGQGAGCLLASGTTSFAGNLTTIMVQCAADGTSEVHLVTESEDIAGFHASYIGGGGTLIPTLYTDALLSCGAAVDTPTPTATNTVAATNTPLPGATNTPCVSSICTNPPFTRTKTPTATTTPGTPTPAVPGATTPAGGGGAAPTSTRVGGGPGGVIGGPDTGTGPGGGDSSTLLTALLASGAGLALVAAGGWTLRSRSARSRR